MTQSLASNYALTRRSVLKAAITIGAAHAIPAIIPASVLGANSPSNRIVLALIGTGNQGTNNLKGFLQLSDVHVRAVCDVNRASYGYKTAAQYLGREPAQQIVDQFYSSKMQNTSIRSCFACIDYRELLARPDIDAVVITVPDHWHAIMAVAAARAGKDIYCEKPLALTISEGRRIVEAVRLHGVVLQTGSHERSNQQSRFACELVRNGRIGQLRKMIAIVGPNNKTAPAHDWIPQPVPEGFDYDRWLGPAPYAPYHPDRCLYNFRFNLDYSGGQTTNYGAHSIDLAQWGNGTERTGPVEVEDLGGEFPSDGLFTAPTKIHFRARYANNVELICKTGPEDVQIRFEGDKGWIQTGYRGFSCWPENLQTTVFGPDDIRLGDSVNHYRDFIDAVKSRGIPSAPAEIGHRSATVCHLGNIAMLLKRKLRWDPDRERFDNDGQANRLLSKPYRAPWHL
jgi:predicted dehydrogenase